MEIFRTIQIMQYNLGGIHSLLKAPSFPLPTPLPPSTLPRPFVAAVLSGFLTKLEFSERTQRIGPRFLSLRRIGKQLTDSPAYFLYTARKIFLHLEPS